MAFDLSSLGPIPAALWLVRVMLLGTVWFTLAALFLWRLREPVRRSALCGAALLGGLALPVLAALLPTGAWTPWSAPRIDLTSVEETVRGTGILLGGEGARSANPEASPTGPLSGSHALSGVSSDADPVRSTGGLWMPRTSSEERPSRGEPSTAKPPGTSLPSPRSGTGRNWRSLASLCTLSNAMLLLVAGYALGVCGFALWYRIGLLGLRRLIRGGTPAGPPIQAIWKDVGGPPLSGVSLVVSDRAPQPIACWFGRPCVVIPAAWAEESPERLTWALAHEAEHLRRGDFWVWQGANLCRILFWCHPLVWLLRRELRLAQDHLADAAAARHAAGTAEPGAAAVEYAEFLTRSAAGVAGRIPLVGLGLFGRRSDLYRRVAMLLKSERPIERRAPRWWTAGLLLGGLATLGGIVTMRVVADPPKPAPPLKSLMAARFQELSVPPPLTLSNTPAVAIEGPVLPSAEALPGSGALRAAGELELAEGSAAPKPPDDAGAGDTPLQGGARLRKLAIKDGVVEPEPGVVIAIRGLSDPSEGGWGVDGARIDPNLQGGGEGAFGSGAAPGMPGGPFGGGSMPMPGAGGSAPLGMGMMGMPGGIAASPPPDTRTRTVTVWVQRPCPSGLQMSVDGQAGPVSSTQLPQAKVRQISQVAYWPQEQMAGSVGVRYASRTVARELVATRPEGEVFRDPEGGIEARLGPWKDANDLRTVVKIDYPAPAENKFVVEAEAEDVDGERHPGRIEALPQTVGGGFGGGPAVVPPPEWIAVFPHLPASRIRKIRITWHPYAWVIFRNVSLEAEHTTAPVAELFFDGAKPPVLSKDLIRRETLEAARKSGRIPEGMTVLLLPRSINPTSRAFQAGDTLCLFVELPQEENRIRRRLLDRVELFGAGAQVPGGAGDNYTFLLEQPEFEYVQLAGRKGKLMMAASDSGQEGRYGVDEALKAELEQLPDRGPAGEEVK